MNKEKLVENILFRWDGRSGRELIKETAKAMKKEYDGILGNLIIHDEKISKENDKFWKKWCE